MYESTVHLRPTHPLEVSLLHPKSKGVFRLRGRLLSLAGAPPIHFGREDGVERTLLRVACQSESFLASPWQGSVDIRVLWHIGCQSDFDELVSMASRPVDRGFGRMAEPSRSFHPVKSRFCRMGCSQQKTPFGRTFPFLTKWFPPLSRGWHCPQGVLLARRRVRRHHFATRKTPLNTSRVLQCSGKGAT